MNEVDVTDSDIWISKTLSTTESGQESGMRNKEAGHGFGDLHRFDVVIVIVIVTITATGECAGTRVRQNEDLEEDKGSRGENYKGRETGSKVGIE